MSQAPAAGEDESSRGDPALIGRTVAGKYKIEKFLGGGAMGAVYKAHQVALEKSVAVKVMHRAIAVDPNFVGRFHREAKAASRLDHPNSMRVLDFGEEPDGLLYIAMEYAEGRDLYRVIHEDWPLSTSDIAHILMQALAAVAVAHDMGVIHRDLKPENLMILRTKNDEEKDAYLVKVCDFGIAKITEKEEPGAGGTPGQKLTTQGLVVGTPEYMSPEQARGEKLDARSDIYSIGIILYQLLTGRTPFTADTALAVVLKHITEPPQPPSVHYAGVHKGLEAVCMRALAKDRDARFQTARAMRAAIREALDGRPQPASDPSAPTAAELPSSNGPGAQARGTAPIVIADGRIGYGAAKSVPAAAESAPTVAGGLTGSHLTPLGTAAAPPEAKKSRTGLAIALGAVVLLAGIGALAGPRLLETSRARAPRDPAEPPTSQVTPPPPTASHAIPVAPSARVITADPPLSPAPTEAKGPRQNLTAPPRPPVVVKGAVEPPPTAIERPAPEAPPPPPAVVVAPPPPVAPPAPPPPAPAFNPSTCRATTGAVRGNGTINTKDLTLNGTAAAWTSCAQNGLKERPPGPISGIVHILFTDNRQFRGASCPSCPGAVAACIASTTQRTVSVNFKGGDVSGEPAFDVPVTIVCE